MYGDTNGKVCKPLWFVGIGRYFKEKHRIYPNLVGLVLLVFFSWLLSRAQVPAALVTTPDYGKGRMR